MLSSPTSATWLASSPADRNCDFILHKLHLLYYLADTFHIFTSLYGMKAGGREPAGGPMWLRSTTGRPEGPYEYVDRPLELLLRCLGV